MASATSALARSTSRFVRIGGTLGSRWTHKHCIHAIRSFSADVGASSQSTSSEKVKPDTPKIWQLKSASALEPLTSPESLKGHEKGLLLEKEDVFCRRMARTWELAANALWTKGSKAEQLLEEACGQQLFDRLIALRKANTGYKSVMKVKSSKLVDYLEFVNVADGKGSVGAFISALMASGNTPTLGHFVSGTRVFVRAKVKFDCVEQINGQDVPSEHVATFEMPFEPVIGDQLTETTAASSKSAKESTGSNGSVNNAASPDAPPASSAGAEGQQAAVDKTGDSHEAEPPASKKQEDELDLPPAGTLKGENGLPMAVAADGRPAAVMSMGPVAPVSGWRMVDINGHQPVTASEFDFVSAMLSRRGGLFPEGDGDAESDDEPEETEAAGGDKGGSSPGEKR